MMDGHGCATVVRVVVEVPETVRKVSTRLLVAVAVLCAVGPALLVWALWPEAGGQAVADVQAGRPVPAMRGDYLAQMADAGVQLADPAPGVLPTSVEDRKSVV